MKPSTIAALALLFAISTVHALGQALTRPKNLNPLIVKPESGPDKKGLLGTAAKLNPAALAKLNIFTHALITPRNPATDNAGLFLERPAAFDPLRDLASFYGSQGNPAVRFYATLVDRPYLVDFLIDNRTGGQAEFAMDYGAVEGSSPGEGFVSVANQVVRLNTGKQHATFVVFPKTAAWNWVSMIAKKANGLWNVVSVEVSYLK